MPSPGEPHAIRRSAARSGLTRVGTALVAISIGVLACSSGSEDSTGAAKPEASPAASLASKLEAASAKLPQKPVERVPLKYVPQYPPEIEARVLEIRKIRATDADALDRALAGLRDEHPGVRMEAISVMEQIRSDAVVVPLGDVLDKDPDEATRLRAVEALDYLNTPAALAQQERGLDDSSADVRELVVENLAFNGGPDLLPKFEAALAKEGDREVREDLEDGIAGFKQDLEKKKSPAAPPAAAEQKAADAGDASKAGAEPGH